MILVIAAMREGKKDDGGIAGGAGTQHHVEGAVSVSSGRWGGEAFMVFYKAEKNGKNEMEME